MHSDDKLKSSAIFDGGWDVHDLDAIAERLTAIGDGVSPPPGTPEGVRSPFMELYASVTRGPMRMFGTTQEHLPAVASKNHRHSTMTPPANYQQNLHIQTLLHPPNHPFPPPSPICSPPTTLSAPTPPFP